MLGLDIIGADVALGISWGDVGDVGKAAFPYVHATGKGIASAFGAGQAAQALENVEVNQGWLPPTPSASMAAVTSSADSVATAATPKLHPGVSPNTSPKSPATTKATPPMLTTLPLTTPPSLTLAQTGGKPASPSQLSTTAIVVGVGVCGFIVLVLRRLWGAH